MRSPSPLIIVPIGLLLLILVFAFLLRNTFRQNAEFEPPAVQDDGVASELVVESSAENPDGHLVQAGETLSIIADRYGVSLNALIATNNIANPDLVEVGTRLIIPDQPIIQSAAAPSNNLIPDSELVYGPSMQGVSIESLVPANSFLWGFTEEVEGMTLNGVEIVRLVAERTRVNPRLLLAALEYRSGWTSGTNPRDTNKPLGYTNLDGLYRQLEWTANLLNLGYYSRSEIGLTQMQLTDGTQITFDSSVSNGTAGVQMWLGQQPSVTLTTWQQDVSSDGFIATYRNLFGDPFANAVDFLPAGLTQPLLSLPWEEGETWHFSGGPHGGWISGSAWAALDFLPGGEQFGCYVAPPVDNGDGGWRHHTQRFWRGGTRFRWRRLYGHRLGDFVSAYCTTGSGSGRDTCATW